MTRRPTGKDRGFTVIETFISLAIFSGILVITTLLLRQSVWVWTSGDSRETANLTLSKARVALSRDLARADIDPSFAGDPHMGEKQAPSSMGGSSAIWFLSAMTENGDFVRDDDGYPFWQRNILYYAAVPQNHNAVFGTTCTLSADPQGDDHCPHKLFIRVVIDNPPATLPPPSPPDPPAPGDEPERLLTDSEIDSYIVAPQGMSLADIYSQPGVQEARVITSGLLWFQVRPSPGDPANGREIDLRAVAQEEAQKVSNLGNVPLLNTPATLRSVFSLFPNN